MAHRREGHLRERSPGHWEVRLSDGKDAVTGKWKIRTATIQGSKRDAQRELNRLVHARDTGTQVDPSKTTLGEYLKIWLAQIKPNVSPTTYERYSDLCLKNIAPLLGGVALSKLEPEQITEAYATALTSGRRDGKGGLSSRTVHHMHRVLHTALQKAVRWKKLRSNPADLEKEERPKVDKKPPVVYSMDEAVDALESLRKTRMFIPALLGMNCGLRRGEVCALRWRSLDLERGKQLAVIANRVQTKDRVWEKETKGSRCRTLALSESDIKELKEHKRKQAEELLALGIRQTLDHHVVTKEDGEPLQPRSVTHEWVRLLGTKKLKRIKLHNTRHSHASHMLADGTHPKIVQERLGHSSIAITMDTYSFAMPNLQQEAVTRVDEARQAALRKRATTPVQ